MMPSLNAAQAISVIKLELAPALLKPDEAEHYATLAWSR
jgi:hypothetical protein